MLGTYECVGGPLDGRRVEIDPFISSSEYVFRDGYYGYRPTRPGVLEWCATSGGAA
jgi:hypothetical protein